MNVETDSEASNISLQADEIQALSSIYGDDWLLEDENMYSIRISNHSGYEVYFQVTLPKAYPLLSPPVYQISQNVGESIIYMWIEKVREFINKYFDHSVEETHLASIEDINEELDQIKLLHQPQDTVVHELPAIEHGETITDRKSVFQAHLAKVVSTDQVKQVLEKLKENKKIASATHNVYAYRIAQGQKELFIQDCEDDGEIKAGSVLLHLLQILDVTDVLVVVSRWYGGIHLGSDRFKHISNAARSLLNQHGFIKNVKGSSTNRKK